MAKINLDRIKAALDKKPAASKTEFKKNTYFKAAIGNYEIRFLPFVSAEGEPFQAVMYYSEKIAEDGRRFVAPQTFGLPDPIRDIFEIKRKEKDGWGIAKFLQTKKRFYGLVIDRANEAAGPQIWEFDEKVRDQVYNRIMSKDNAEEDLFDPKRGYDWELNINQVSEGGKLKTFNGSPVKSYTLTEKKKPSPLSKDEALANKWLAEMPNLEAMFKAMCKTEEKMMENLENFLSKLESGGNSSAGEEGTEHTVAVAKVSAEELPSTPKTKAKKAAVVIPDGNDILDDAFSAAGLAD